MHYRRSRLAAIIILLFGIGLSFIPARTGAQSGPVDITIRPYCVGNGDYDAGCYTVTPEFPAIGATVTATPTHYIPDNGYNVHIQFSPCAAVHIDSQTGWTSFGFGFRYYYNACDTSGTSGSDQGETDVGPIEIPDTIYVKYIGANSTTPFTLNFHVVSVQDVTPDQPAITKYQPCPSQNDNGVLPGTWKYDPPVVADESGIGLDLNNGVIEKNFSLSRFHRYKIALNYALTEAGPIEYFSFGFGDFSASLHTAETTDETTTVFPELSIAPTFTSGGTDIYRAVIGEFTPADSPHLVINYFCVTDLDATTGDGTGGAPSGPSDVVCKDCIYEATGDLIGDILGVLKWIWCGLSQLWDCTIKSLFYGIWKFVGVIITALAFARQWAGLVLSNALAWIGPTALTLWNFIRGLAGNIIITAFNALAGVFNALGITGIINTILAFLANIPGAISNFLQIIPGVVSLLSTIWDFIVYWVTTVWNVVSGVLGAIPVVFASVADGFNQSAASIPVYAPTCNSSNTLFFGPCLGMYIIDNTVFDGPMYYVFPVVLGFIAINTILWSIEKIKEALSGD